MMAQTNMSARDTSQQRRRLAGQASSTIGSQNSGVKKFDEYRRSVNEPTMAELTDSDNMETPGLVGRATRMVRQSLNFGASASGSSTATNEVKDILRELVEGGYLCDGTALPNTWLARLDGKE
mmetsp:Transcript_1817/g.2998  ORF Transcript_1817/g.2998 Transcript_1817/m.2998 type:complete len:123 (-) Transcript_1817:362-730(-)